MNDREIDEEMLWQMLEWLNRGMDVEGDFPELHARVELALTEVDREFLRAYRIAIP